MFDGTRRAPDVIEILVVPLQFCTVWIDSYKGIRSHGLSWSAGHETAAPEHCQNDNSDTDNGHDEKYFYHHTERVVHLLFCRFLGADKVFQIQGKYQVVVMFLRRKTPTGQEVKKLSNFNLLRNTSQWHLNGKLCKCIKNRTRDENHYVVAIARRINETGKSEAQCWRNRCES